jgi:sulfopyruvate decarboxylase alpha subunit
METGADWPEQIYQRLKEANIRQMSYVPDAGHARLIELFNADAGVRTSVLTTEEEGVAVSAGAWLGGERSVLLMQSSGVGNCINMLSLMPNCRIPFLALVTMRGEWAEFNPWQVPMGQATQTVLGAMGVHVIRINSAKEVADALDSALTLAFDSDMAVAVLLSQKLVGRKQWTK